MTTEWQVIVTFAGLILFVQDKASITNPKLITHALLADGRAGHHHHGSTLSSDIHDCDHLVRADFDHRPLLWWETGEADSPVLGPDGEVLRQVGGKSLKDRSEIFLRWCCDGKVCGSVDEVATCWTAAKASKTGAGNKAHAPLGATPVGPEASKLGRLPEQDQYQTPAGSRRSFFWVPKLQDLGMENSVAKSTLTEWADAPSAVFARIPLSQGYISSGDYSWIYSESVQWVPRLRFLSGHTGGGRMKRAGAEVVHWEPKAPEGATTLQIVRREFVHPDTEAVIAAFRSGESPVQITISNSPKRRCWGRPHPGRRADTATMHFEMLYDLLGPDGTRGRHDPSQHIAPADRLIPKAPAVLHPKWCPIHGKTLVPYWPWMPGAPTKASASSSGDPDEEGRLFGDVADAVGTKERPICVPAYSDG